MSIQKYQVKERNAVNGWIYYFDTSIVSKKDMYYNYLALLSGLLYCHYNIYVAIDDAEQWTEYTIDIALDDVEKHVRLLK